MTPPALWIFFLLVAPVITALIYIIVRGNGMTERNIKAVTNAQKDAEEYVRRMAATSSPADQIASAKALLDSGAITDAEYQQLKAKVLA